MEWIETRDGKSRKWIPKGQQARLDKAKALADKTRAAHKAFKLAKRRKEKPDALKALRSARDKAVAAYAANRGQIVEKGVAVVEKYNGFCVFRHNTGTKLHSKHDTLKDAQEAARTL